MRLLTRFTLLVAALAMLVAACSTTSDPEPTVTSSSTTTTVADTGTSADEDIVFASGSLPDTVPSDFPFPDQAVVGSTLVDRTRGLTEAIVTYPANVEDVVDFFEANLPTFGYVIVTSDGSDGAWVLEFSKDGLEGVISLDTGGSGLSQGTIRLTRPTG